MMRISSLRFGSLRSRLLVTGYWLMVFANNHEPITNNGGAAEGRAVR